MLRLTFLLLALVLPAPAQLPDPFGGTGATGRALVAPAAPDPVRRAGAIIWAHGSYDLSARPPPDPAPFVARLDGFDLWRFDQQSDQPGSDPLEAGGAALAAAARSLRAMGYRRVVLAGHSRGAFLALVALPAAAADAVVLVSPAAHGTSPVRRPQALAAFRAALDMAGPGAAGAIAMVLFADDPFEPDLAARRTAAVDAASRIGAYALVLVQPAGGHDGGFDRDFDARHGACLAAAARGDPCTQ
jgi:pimeloyl-ACP methyl ester carboxylesterase